MILIRAIKYCLENQYLIDQILCTFSKDCDIIKYEFLA